MNNTDYSYFIKNADSGEAHITVNRNRIKVYPGEQVYLKDKQEFEIELFNPTSITKLAKILMNGKLISTAGIVLKPGQRVYLERYLDTPKKFLFETYTVQGNSAQIQKAIELNGNIEIAFYNEYTPPAVTYAYNTLTAGSGGTTGQYVNTYFSTTSENAFNGSVDKRLFNRSSKTADLSCQSLHYANDEVETGRIEKGSYSDQDFTHYNGQFNSWTTNTVRIKILPHSSKPLEASELAQYCTNCGTKNKKGNYKFCPSCGTKY